MRPIFQRRLPAPGGIAMIHTQLSSALKDAMKAKDDVALRTVRLILAALKDRDIAARGHGNTDGIEDDEILGLLQTMIKQRREAIALYEQGGRLDLAGPEGAEIPAIARFRPRPMSEVETRR